MGLTFLLEGKYQHLFTFLSRTLCDGERAHTHTNTHQIGSSYFRSMLDESRFNINQQDKQNVPNMHWMYSKQSAAAVTASAPLPSVGHRGLQACRRWRPQAPPLPLQKTPIGAVTFRPADKRIGGEVFRVDMRDYQVEGMTGFIYRNLNYQLSCKSVKSNP